MKKILLISDNKIFGFGGGSLEEHKYYDGLRYFADTYGCELKVISIDEPFDDMLTERIVKSHRHDMMSRLIGHSTFIYFVWKKYRGEVLKYNPDLIVLGRSRMGFIAKDIKRILPSCKIVCNMENVEYDYVEGYFSNKKGCFKSLLINWEKLCVKRDEKNAVKYSDAIDYLTDRDYKRTHELYDVKDKREMVLPICIKKEIQLINKSDKKTIVFIGSLSYGSNVNSLLTFIEEVWKPFFENRHDISFVIGGINPNDALKKIIAEISNCKLCDNFKRLEDIVPQGSLMIAPIAKGAGMKVKVAETLSMGLPIVASDEALVGYENAIQNDKLSCIMRANTPDEYKAKINAYLNTDEDTLDAISSQNKELYKLFYSYSRSRVAIEKMCIEELE